MSEEKKALKIPHEEMWDWLANFEITEDDTMPGMAVHQSRFIQVNTLRFDIGDYFNASEFMEHFFGLCYMMGKKDGINEGQRAANERLSNKLHELLDL